MVFLKVSDRYPEERSIFQRGSLANYQPAKKGHETRTSKHL